MSAGRYRRYPAEEEKCHDAWLGGIFLINYEEELKKFKPSLDVDEAEGAIYSRDLTDVIDILKEMMKETSENEKDNKR